MLKSIFMISHTNKKSMMTYYKDLILFTILLFSVQGCSADKKASGPVAVSITIPLYIYPTTLNTHTGSSYWKEVIESVSEHTPITAIINPNNGDHGRYPDNNFVKGIQALRDNDIVTLGYTYTQYAHRDSDKIKESIDFYHKYYHVDGIFFDEANSSNEALPYYQTLRSAMDVFTQMRQNIINPGVVPEKEFIDTADALQNVVVFEGNFARFEKSEFDLSHSGQNKNAFICLVYETPVAKMEEAVDLAIEKHCGHIYITDDGGTNPWDTLPIYWDEFISYISKVNTQ